VTRSATTTPWGSRATSCSGADTLIAIQGPSPSRLQEQGFARVNLAGLLLDPGQADDARTLFRSTGRPADLPPTRSAESDADYRTWHDTIAARIARR
jgi:hypothetical protein